MMDVYNLIQEQLVHINNSLNHGFKKIYEELEHLTQRVSQLEMAQNRVDLQNQLDQIRSKMELLPKIHGNQVGALQTMLVGHQFQYKKLNGLMAKHTEQNTAVTTPSSFATPGAPDEDGVDEDQESIGRDQACEEEERANTIINGAATVTIAPVSPGPISASTTVNSSINVPSMNPINSTAALEQPTPQIRNPNIGISVNNRVNPSPVYSSQSFQLISQPHQAQQDSATDTLSSVRSFPSMSPMNDATSVSSSHSSPQQVEIPQILNDINSSIPTISASGRNVWDNVPFHSLHPNPKTVEDVLDEYYYGYQGQPPLKYLEEHRKGWRKNDNKLCKAFTRRYRIVVAVEGGVRIYTRDYGLRENIAREKIVKELEDLRVKENGKRETMYWLFHHIPSHLKKK